MILYDIIPYDILYTGDTDRWPCLANWHPTVQEKKLAELLPGCCAPFYSIMLTCYANYLAQSLQARMNPSITSGFFHHMVEARNQNLMLLAIQSQKQNNNNNNNNNNKNFTTEIFTKSYLPSENNPFLSTTSSTSSLTKRKTIQKVYDISNIDNTKVTSSSPLTRMFYIVCM